MLGDYIMVEGEIGVAFITFDFRKGHIIPFYSNLAPKFCDAMALKILIAGLAGDRSGENESYYGSSLTPFSKQEKLVYSYLFSISEEDTNEPRPSAISLAFPRSKENLIYRIAPTLGLLLEEIATKIQKGFKFGRDLTSQIKQMLEKLLDYQYLEDKMTLDLESVEKILPKLDLKEAFMQSFDQSTEDQLEKIDIPRMIPEASTRLFRYSGNIKDLEDRFGAKLFQVLRLINGKRTINEFSSQLNIDTSEIMS